VEPELFYWIGSVLAVLAVLVSLIGLRAKAFPASRGAMLGTLTVFAVLVLGTTTYGVVKARDEQGHREAELAEAEREAGEEEIEAQQTGEEGPDIASPADEQEVAEEEGTVAMSEYQFAPSEVTVANGETVTAENDGETLHNLAVFEGDEELGTTPDVDPGGSDELAVDFEPGNYEMICTIPGHADLGMTGTFTVE
jgi:plastocyanin